MAELESRQTQYELIYAALIFAMKRPSSARRRALSEDSDCAERSTSSDAAPVSFAPRLTSVMSVAAARVPVATPCTLRAMSCVAAPCCSTALAMVAAPIVTTKAANDGWVPSEALQRYLKRTESG